MTEAISFDLSSYCAGLSFVVEVGALDLVHGFPYVQELRREAKMPLLSPEMRKIGASKVCAATLSLRFTMPVILLPLAL